MITPGTIVGVPNLTFGLHESKPWPFLLGLGISGGQSFLNRPTVHIRHDIEKGLLPFANAYLLAR